jgi:hypothetical protein
MSEIPRAKPPSPVVSKALETKTMPSAKQLEALTPDQRRVVTAFLQLTDHASAASAKPKRTLD